MKERFKSYRFLKRAASKGSGFLSVDTVSCDGHQVTLSCHRITQQGQMAVVDIGTIKGDDVVHFLLNGLSYSLYTQDL